MVVAPPSTAAPPVVPEEIPVPVSADSVVMAEADLAFDAGRYPNAAGVYARYLQVFPNGSQRDQALFRLALTSVLSSTPAPDWPRASMLLKQIVSEYPKSSLRPAAMIILSLYAQVNQLTGDERERDQKIKQLTNELDKLKKIDADRHKQP